MEFSFPEKKKKKKKITKNKIYTRGKIHKMQSQMLYCKYLQRGGIA